MRVIPNIDDRTYRLLRIGGVGVLATVTVAWLWTSLIAIGNFAFRYPVFDQFRLYNVYLGQPFLDAVVQLENGHRPILPALVRIAELRGFEGGQTLQVVVGLAAALLAAGLLALSAVRERDAAPLLRAVAVLVTVLALFWLGNARLLMHGHELVHIYFVVLFCVLALLAMVRAGSDRLARWPWLAAICCIAATFSFGPGMASFGAVLLLGLLARMPWRHLAILGGTLVVTLVLYLFVLPGDQGVRGSLALDPLQDIGLLARWLAAPGMRAWLGHGEPPLEAWLQPALEANKIGHLLRASAGWIATPFGVRAPYHIATLVGAAGLGLWLSMLWRTWRTHATVSRTGLLGLGLASFAVGGGIIVCLGRLQYFAEIPREVFADRYLPWSCLFWLGLALHALLARPPRSAWRGRLAPVLALALAVLLLPTQEALAGWSEVVSRRVTASAVAAQLDIWDPQRFGDASASEQQTADSLALLRERHLAMFGEPARALVEAHWHAPTLDVPEGGGRAGIVRVFEDPHSQHQVAEFGGSMPRLDAAGRDPLLVVVDADGALRGLAKSSWLGPGKHALRFNLAWRHGFDGYVRDPRPGELLSILVLDEAHEPLVRIPLQVPHSPAGE